MYYAMSIPQKLVLYTTSLRTVALLSLQVMLHRLGQQQATDQCILQETQSECFLELTATSDGSYITINSNAKTASEVGQLQAPSTGSGYSEL